MIAWIAELCTETDARQQHGEKASRRYGHAMNHANQNSNSCASQVPSCSGKLREHELMLSRSRNTDVFRIGLQLRQSGDSQVVVICVAPPQTAVSATKSFSSAKWPRSFSEILFRFIRAAAVDLSLLPGIGVEPELQLCGSDALERPVNYAHLCSINHAGRAVTHVFVHFASTRGQERGLAEIVPWVPGRQEVQSMPRFLQRYRVLVAETRLYFTKRTGDLVSEVVINGIYIDGVVIEIRVAALRVFTSDCNSSRSSCVSVTLNFAMIELFSRFPAIHAVLGEGRSSHAQIQLRLLRPARPLQPVYSSRQVGRTVPMLSPLQNIVDSV